MYCIRKKIPVHYPHFVVRRSRGAQKKNLLFFFCCCCCCCCHIIKSYLMPTKTLQCHFNRCNRNSLRTPLHNFRFFFGGGGIFHTKSSIPFLCIYPTLFFISESGESGVRGGGDGREKRIRK